MRVEVAKHAGVCYGVERALKMVEEAVAQGRPVDTLGPLIHNPQAVGALRDRGVEVTACVDEARDGTLVIRTHGVNPEVIEEARARGLEVVDATCPFVVKAQAAARALTREGYTLVIVGEPDHPEVEGIFAHAAREALIVESPADLPQRLASAKVGVVVQTTQPPALLHEVVDALLARAAELRVFNTICSATERRQEAARELAGHVDVVLVVGGRNSGNTTRLAEISRKVNPRTYHVETADELEAAWFEGVNVVGVTAGASTPDEQMADVVRAVEALG